MSSAKEKYWKLHIAIDNTVKPFPNSETKIVFKTKEMVVLKRSANWVFTFLKPLLLYGHMLCIIPYRVLHTVHTELDVEKGKSFSHAPYYLKRNKFFERLTPFLQTFFMAFMTHRLFTYEIVEGFSIMEWILRFCFTFQILYAIATYVSLSSNKLLFPKLLHQSDIILQKFEEFAVDWKENFFHMLGISISIVYFSLGILHIVFLKKISNSDVTVIQDDEHLKNLPFTNYRAEDLKWDPIPTAILYCVTQFPDVFSWGALYYADAVRLYLAIVIWKMYATLNEIIQSDEETMKLDINKIFNLHISISKLLRYMNRLISAMTFISTLFVFGYCCYYINFSMVEAPSINRWIILLIFFLRTCVPLIIAADVNTKAHTISEWLEDICCAPNNNFGNNQIGGLNDLSEKKIAVIAAQVYHKENIGFTGMNYFTVSNSYISTICSVIFTYTLIITQFTQVKANQTGY